MLRRSIKERGWGETLDWAVSLLVCVAEFYMYYDFFGGFFYLRGSFRILWKRVLALISLGTCLFGINLLGNSYVNLIASAMLLWICCMMFYQGSIGKKALCSIVALFVVVGCEFLFNVLLNIRVFVERQKSVTNLADFPWQIFTMKLMTFIIFIMIKQCGAYTKQEMRSRIFLYYLCIPISSVGIMLMTYYIGMNDSMGQVERGLFSACFAIMLFGNMAVFRAFCRYSEELVRNAEQKLVISRQSMELQYYGQVQSMDREQKEFIHNVSNCLKVIGVMARENKAESILSVLQGLHVELEKNVSEVLCKNPAVNTVLAEKKASAQREGIELDAYVEPGVNLDWITYADIITMLGNLLDNALRAAGHADCRTVTVRIYAQNGGELWIVKIQNHYKGELIRTGEGFLTTKEEGGIHGIGIQSVKKTARKYGGDLQCIVEGQLFTAVLLLPNGT